MRGACRGRVRGMTETNCGDHRTHSNFNYRDSISNRYRIRPLIADSCPFTRGTFQHQVSCLPIINQRRLLVTLTTRPILAYNAAAISVVYLSLLQRGRSLISFHRPRVVATRISFLIHFVEALNERSG